MRRRQFLANAVAAAVTASVAGCSGLLGGDGSAGPGATTDGFLEAGMEGDTDEAREYVHPEGELTGSTASDLQSSVEAIRSTDVSEQSGGRATVVTVIELTDRRQLEMTSPTATITLEFDLRKHEGDWKIYEYGARE